MNTPFSVSRWAWRLVVMLAMMGAVAPASKAQDGSTPTRDPRPWATTGEVSCEGWSKAGIGLGRIRVRYHYDALIGEPLERYDVMFEDAEHPAKIHKIRFRGRVTSGGQDTGCTLDFEPGFYDEKRGVWYTDPIWGSPNWEKWLTDADGRYVDKKTVQRLFSRGFGLSSMEVIEASEEWDEWVKAGMPSNADGMLNRIWTASSGEGTELGAWLPYASTRSVNMHLVAGMRTNQEALDERQKKWPTVVSYASQSSNIPVTCRPKGLSCSLPFEPEIDVWWLTKSVMARLVVPSLPDEFKWDGETFEKQFSIKAPYKVEVTLTIVADGKTQTCRRQMEMTPGKRLEIATALYLPVEPDLGNLPAPAKRHDATVTAAVVITIPKNLLPPREKDKQEESKDPFAAKDTKDPFAPKADGNVFEQQQAEDRKRRIEELQKEARSLGAVTTEDKSITLIAWDYSAEDGDRVEILSNKSIVISDLYLRKVPQEFRITLEAGVNAVVIRALTEGTNPPNTASFKVLAGGGVLKEAKWELMQGEKAVLVVVRLD